MVRVDITIVNETGWSVEEVVDMKTLTESQIQAHNTYMELGFKTYEDRVDRYRLCIRRLAALVPGLGNVVG